MQFDGDSPLAGRRVATARHLQDDCDHVAVDADRAAAALAELDVPYEVHGLVGAVENMPGGKATKPGDVHTGMDGTTVEILNTSPDLHPIQAAFVATGALQSGYSAGAMILGTMALLERDPDPSEAEN